MFLKFSIVRCPVLSLHAHARKTERPCVFLAPLCVLADADITMLEPRKLELLKVASELL